MDFLTALSASFEAIGILFLASLAGFFATRSGRMSAEGVGSLTKLMIDLIIPCMLFAGMLKGFNADFFVEASGALLAPVIYLPLSGFAVLVLFHLWPGDNQKADQASAAMAAIPNSFYIPFPLAIAVTPPELHVAATVIVGIGVLAVNPLQWTFGTFLASGGGHRGEEGGWKASLLSVVNPPVMGIVLGVVAAMVAPPLVAAANKEPDSILALRIVIGAMDFLGESMAPLAMVILGALIGQCEIRKSLTWRRVMPILLTRFLIVPGIVTWLIWQDWIPGSGLAKFIIVMTAAAPSATNLTLVARRYGGEWEIVSGQQLVVNTLAILVLPFWMALGLKLGELG